MMKDVTEIERININKMKKERSAMKKMIMNAGIAALLNTEGHTMFNEYEQEDSHYAFQSIDADLTLDV